MAFYKRPSPKYRDRNEAGKVLAPELLEYKDKGVIVLAVPNGGVPVACVIAKELHADLYLMIVRKLQIPSNTEAGFGALTSDGFVLFNQRLIDSLHMSEDDIEKQREKAYQSIRSRQKYFGNQAVLPCLKDRIIILVDDGLASGFTMEAALKSVKSRGAKCIVIAVPTSSLSAFQRLKPQVDRIICPDISSLPVFAVADAYRNWYDLNEAEALSLLS
ncbi:MAG: phosphoribosyltransferase family protein [Thermodesulfobacteriota bacterium]|nr:phosphoribosyltransferase family protein [Thermodesulfobacteriota bacterium]